MHIHVIGDAEITNDKPRLRAKLNGTCELFFVFLHACRLLVGDYVMTQTSHMTGLSFFAPGKISLTDAGILISVIKSCHCVVAL